MEKKMKKLTIYRKMRKRFIYIFPTLFTKIIFKKILGFPLDLNNPKTFSEKLQWLKLKYYPKYELAASAGDKAMLHEYLRVKGLQNYEVPIVGVYNRYDEIIWENVPNEFVIKKSNASGMNVVVKDKNSINLNELEKTVEKWLNFDYGKETVEYHYSNMTTRIVIERFMAGIEKEYQLYTFNGEVKSLQVMEFQVEACSEEISEGKIINSRNYINIDEFIDKNSLLNFTELVDAAEKIGCDFPLARVDFFLSENHWYIGEITLTPSGGFNQLSTEKQNQWGNWLILPSDVLN